MWGWGGFCRPQSISGATLKILHSFPAPLMRRSACEFALFFKRAQPVSSRGFCGGAHVLAFEGRFPHLLKSCTCSPGLG